MFKNVRNIVFVGGALSLLYLTSIFVYLGFVAFLPFRTHALLMAFIFALSLISCLYVVKFKEWARISLVVLNAFSVLYSIYLFKQFPDFIEPSYVLMSLIVVLFFSQPIVKLQFKPTWYPRKSILVVDDDEGIQRTLQRVLLSNGYSVLTAATGERGLQVARLQKPDLIVLDVILPGIKGRDVCARLKEEQETKKIPVVFLTAKDSPDDIKAEMAAGATTHLTKPVNTKELLATIKSIIGS